MADAVIDLFAEDQAHENFLRALIRRLCDEKGKTIDLRVRSARGGHGQALSEFSLYQRALLSGLAGQERPDLLVVAIDANCSKLTAMQQAVSAQIGDEFRDRTVIATPDPHIERWYIADPKSFAGIVGVQPQLEKRKCDRDRYKQILADAVARAGHISTLGGIEFASELVEGMDLYRAGKAEPSLGMLVKGLSASIKQLD